VGRQSPGGVDEGTRQRNGGMKVVLQGRWEKKGRGDRGGQQKERRLVGLSKVCVMGCRLKRVIHDVIDKLQPDYSVRAQASGGYE
jgi:hypothetical protein